MRTTDQILDEMEERFRQAKDPAEEKRMFFEWLATDEAIQVLSDPSVDIVIERV